MPTLSSTRAIDALDPVMEDAPPAAATTLDVNEGKSIADIRGEKEARRREMFEEDKDGKMRGKAGSDTAALPVLRRCVTSCRGNCLFRNCVAREPETPLTELHLMQPVLGLLLLLAVLTMLLTVAVAVNVVPLEGAGLRGVELWSAGLAAVASVALLYVGKIAKDVPTHEQLNVALNARVDWLGDSVDGVRPRRAEQYPPSLDATCLDVACARIARCGRPSPTPRMRRSSRG